MIRRFRDWIRRARATRAAIVDAPPREVLEAQRRIATLERRLTVATRGGANGGNGGHKRR